MKAAGSFLDHSFGCDHQNCAQLPTSRFLQPFSDVVIWPEASSTTTTHSGEENGAAGQREEAMRLQLATLNSL